MANREHLSILKQGVATWNHWREEHPDIEPDLIEADFHSANLSEANLKNSKLVNSKLIKTDLVGADLSGVNLMKADLRAAVLIGANLSGAHLVEANLFWANLRHAKLIDANLSDTNLVETNFSEANLRRANLRRANLGGANFSAGAILSEADFNQSRVAWTIFADVDLSAAKGLETVVQDGPSSIAIDTVYKSGGKIPEIFLRKAGVHGEFITYAASLAGRPIQFHSCFISYSTKDQDFADRLYTDLQAEGVQCWFATHHMQSGKKVHEQIDKAIRTHERLLLILSPESMKSEWVKTEISKARKREIREQRRILFPVGLVNFESLHDWECFDADTGKDSAREIREYFIPDFSRWKDDGFYQQAFERLGA